jgi:hypothetical protein
LARRRRARELREYRVDERERQRACRARRRGQDERVSRPGLVVEVPALQRDLLESVDRIVEMSRAGLRREVARLLRLRTPILGADVAVGS